MPSQPPKNKWAPYACSGVLDESVTPSKVGGSGLLDCDNLIYERDQAWGKRSGTSLAYQIAASSGAFPNSPYVSGVRWYRAYPTALTKTVFAAAGSLWEADDLNSVPTKLLDFLTAPVEPIRFCSARDPNAMLGVNDGSDILIICGAHTDLSFATSFLAITTSGPQGPGSVGQNPAPTATITLQFQRNGGTDYTPDGASTGGSDPFEILYQILPTDSAATIAANLTTLVNESYPVVTNPNGPDAGADNPFLCQSYSLSDTTGFPQGGIIHFGALLAGTDGNDIKLKVTYKAGASNMGGNGSIAFTSNGTSPTFTPASTGTSVSDPSMFGFFEHGGVNTFQPLKWDGENPVDGLSYQVDRGFHNCVTWHDHVWLWGAKTDPDTLFATDIDQPEGFTFMIQEGGYDIGAGDGDPSVQSCVPIGNTLYVFKTQSIYAINGYDFQGGEYAFSVTPQVQG